MRIANRVRAALEDKARHEDGGRLKIILRGSLAFTGEGHGALRAVALGVLGFKPETIDMNAAENALLELDRAQQFEMSVGGVIQFDPKSDIVLDYEQPVALHPNEIECVLYGSAETVVWRNTYYSTGGGFIASRKQLEAPTRDDIVQTGNEVPYEFSSAAELLDLCCQHDADIRDIILSNEDAKRSHDETLSRLAAIKQVMMDCIDRGLETQGILPGGLEVTRRAPGLWEKLLQQPQANEKEQLFDWLNVYAMAVNEENAAGGRVVTAPTNGAAGIIPSIIRHYCSDTPTATRDTETFLLTAGGIGLLYKQRASISGAEMGCQGEVGVACSMAAGGLAAIWGGTPQQVAQAAEIGMEHNLGLTCDPVGGLVQIPCIERNALGAVKAVNAARLALRSDGPMKVTLDQVIESMRQTGLDMSSKYKETSLGGLAVNVVEC